MPLLAPEHVAVIALTAVATVAAVWMARAHPGRWVVTFSRALAIAIALAYIVENVANGLHGYWNLRGSLPLHLTDAVTIVAVIALWTPRPLLVELTYFWGLGASLQAVLTPDLGQAFPDVFWFAYFVSHCGAVLAAAFLVFGRRLEPRPGAVGRVYAATVLMAVAAAIANLATGGNYMFLREKPSRGSLMELMGSWPWYVAVLAVVTLLVLLILDLPFRRRRLR